jgi:alkylation response protein AidB-like acyl-CoA dehydrogenase
VFFDDVRVGPEALIGERGNGLRQVFAGLNPERITAACISNGIARYALAKATRYANERAVWKGVPIGAHQGVAHPLAEAYIGTQLSRLMAFRAAEIYDEGGDAAEAANIAKFAAADSSLKTLDQAMQTHGGNGMSLEYGMADLWFVARMLKTAPVSREMVLNFVAQRSLGLPASY